MNRKTWQWIIFPFSDEKKKFFHNFLKYDSPKIKNEKWLEKNVVLNMKKHGLCDLMVIGRHTPSRYKVLWGL